MRLRSVVLLAVLSALWIFGLWDQTYSREATMRYLALSLALVAISVWRLKPRRSDRREPRREWRQPPD